MAGSLSGIHIYAVFLSKASGEVLKKYSDQTDVEVWILPVYESSAWSIMAISFTSLLAMSAVLATCFFVRRHQIRRDRGMIPVTWEFHGMSSQLVKAMPSLIFTKVQEDSSTSSSCAICLEDYSFGEKLRVLPCHHKFHATCVDMWLTSWKTFCPVCKRDASAGTSKPPASESTPLLFSVIHMPAESTALSSFRSTVAVSPPRPIRSTSRSNADLANMSSQWSHAPHQAFMHSLRDGHLSLPINIGYTMPHVSPSDYGSASLGTSHSHHGSLSYYRSSLGQQHSYPMHRTESGPSLFTMAPQSPQ